jgi:hypothetical protein
MDYRQSASWETKADGRWRRPEERKQPQGELASGLGSPYARVATGP